MPGPYRCIRLVTHAWRNRLYRLPPKTTTYILHVVTITTQTHDRRKSIGEKKQKKRKEDKGKERKEFKAKQKKRKRKGKKRKRQEEEARNGKKRKRKKVILADPRNWLKAALGSLLFKPDDRPIYLDVNRIKPSRL